MQTVVTLVIRQPIMEYVRQWYDAGMKYERVGGKIRFRLPLDSEAYSRIHTLVEQGKVHLAERYERIELTKKELDEHPFFEMGDERLLLFPEEYNPVAPGCPHCGFGKRLPDKLRLPVGQLKKNRLSIIGMAAASEQIMLIPASLQTLFNGCSGISFSPVEPISPSRNGIDYIRMKVTSILPPMSGRTHFRPNGQPFCKECHQPGWTLYEDVFYRDSIQSTMADFNVTAESIGGMPFQWVIVSQKVRRLMLANKLLSPGCFHPVFFVPKDADKANPVWQDSPSVESEQGIPPRHAQNGVFSENAVELPSKIIMPDDPELLRLENAIIAGLEDGSLHEADVTYILDSDRHLKKDDDVRLKELQDACHSGRYQPSLRLETAIRTMQKNRLSEIRKRVADAGISIPDWQNKERN